MMEQLQQGLLQTVTAAFLVALFQQMMPEGSVKQIGNFLGGLILLLTLLLPLSNLREAEWERDLADWEREIGVETEYYHREQNNQWRQLIEKNTGAYIEDKAAQLGLSCSVTVEAEENEDGIPCPVRVTLSIEKDPQLSGLISQQLGIREECQIWLES